MLDPPRSAWTKPRHLPHYHPGQELQCVTYRLKDALPLGVARRRPEEEYDGPEAAAYHARMEAALDAGYGSRALADPKAARLVVDAWRHFHGTRYHLIAWVVMPTHVHVLIHLLGTASLATTVQSWKSFTSRRLPVGWQRDYWDTCLRDHDHLRATVAYIHDNPVSAGLCQHPADWPWSSCRSWLAEAGGGASSNSPPQPPPSP